MRHHPRPAEPGFPYLDHMTWAGVRRQQSGVFTRRAAYHPTRVPDGGKNGLKIKSTMPPAPCFRCGGRGWCGHDGRVAQ